MKKLLTYSLFTFAFSLFTAVCNAQIIHTIAGIDTAGYSGDGGQATAAELFNPFGLVLDASGNIFIADAGNNVVRKISAASGIITTVAGNHFLGFNGDGIQATSAELNDPSGITLDNKGNLYISDQNNFRVRMVNLSSGIITTVAGNGVGGFSGDGAAASLCELYDPASVAVDTAGNIYIGDYGNNVIRKVYTGTGLINTIAGNYAYGPGYSGDGGFATLAELDGPGGVILDASGNLWFSDALNNVVRMVNISTGIITTVAGKNSYGNGYSGDGAQATLAELNYPNGICFDKSGNFYIADFSNSRVRIVNSSGIINTFAGEGAYGFSGDGGPATAAELHDPLCVAIDNGGDIYIADYANNRVRKVSSPSAINTINNVSGNIEVYPNPSGGNFEFQITNFKSGNMKVEVYNVLGEQVYNSQCTIHNSPFTVDLSSNPAGIYLYRFIAENGNLIGEGKLVIQR